MPAAQFVIGTLNIKAVMPCLATARETCATMRRRPSCGQKLSSIGCRLPDSMLCHSPLVLPGVVQNDCPEPLSQSELATKPADKASQKHPPHPCWTRPQVHLSMLALDVISLKAEPASNRDAPESSAAGWLGTFGPPVWGCC